MNKTEKIMIKVWGRKVLRKIFGLLNPLWMRKKTKKSRRYMETSISCNSWNIFSEWTQQDYQRRFVNRPKVRWRVDAERDLNKLERKK